MTDQPPSDESAHLRRSRTKWNRWSEYYTLSERDFEPIRERAMEQLSLEPGDSVLDIGCGPGVNFARLRADVGPSGSVHGIDYSPAMIDRARDRIATHGWSNVTVEQADASTVTVDTPYDAAIATLSLSIMPDVDRTVERIHDALAPGASLAVVDLRAAPSGPLRLINPFWRVFLRWYANWNPDGDVPAALERTFDRTELIETNLLGLSYTTIATRSD